MVAMFFALGIIAYGLKLLNEYELIFLGLCLIAQAIVMM